VAACTPFRYGEILRAYRDPVITAFATGSVLVVLPLLVERTRRLFEERELTHEETGATVEALYPLAYPFPHLGRLIGLLFIPFTAWFVGRSMGLLDYPQFLVSGFLAYFGGPMVATPFLLDHLRLPSDMFQLFLITGVYGSRLSNLLGSMHFIALVLISTCAMTGLFRIRKGKILTLIGVAATLLLGVVMGTRAFLAWSFKDAYDRDEVITGMRLQEETVPAIVVDEPAPNPVPLRPGRTRLERIRSRDVIRIGYMRDNLPFSYENEHGNLVGFDVDLAHRLAKDLAVEIEFVPFEGDTLGRQLEADHFDLAMSGVVGTIPRAERMLLSRGYQDVTVALVVRDHRTEEFATVAQIRQMKGLRLGVHLKGPLIEKIRRNLPDGEIVRFDSVRAFLEAGEGEADALLTLAESGSAWTLLYPSFQAVVPSDRVITGPLVFPIGGRDAALKAFVDHWIAVKKGDGTIRRAYDHWILGRTAEIRRPRWSIMRNVLGWGE
jgi:ABC-type amino acid transport substrate-binding protein